jgi:histone deacetylase complex regulatory component SIN3
MPAELRESLETAAKQAKRSLNAEIIARLESTFAEEDRVLNMDFSDYLAEIQAAAEGETIAAQAPELKERVAAIEKRTEQIIELLHKLTD